MPMNLSFAAPSFLWALPLAALPVIIHFVFRKKSIVVDFSSIYFIKLVTKRNVAYSKLRNILLLASRVIIILLLVFLFSRAVFFSSGGSKQAESAHSIVFMIDNSYSMGYNTGDGIFFDKVKESADQAIRQMGSNDKAALVAFSDRVEFISGRFTNDKQALSEELSKINLTSNPSDIKPAMEAVAELINNSRSQNNAAVIYSDFNKNGWENIAADYAAFKSAFSKPGFRVVAAVNKLAVKNRAIISAGITGSYHNEPAELKVSLVNFSPSVFKQEIDVFMGGEKRAQSAVELGAEEEAVKIFKINLPKSEGFKLSAKLKSDSLPADDEFHIYKNVSAGVKILIVDGEAKLSTVKSETFFLRAALSPDNAYSGIKADVINIGELADDKIFTAKVIFLCNIEKLSSSAADSLKKFIEGGGAVFFSAGDNMKKENYEAFSGILPVEVISPRTAGAGLKIKYGSEDKHKFSEKLGFTSDISFNKYMLVRAKFGAKAVLAFENNAGLLVEKEIGAGKSLFFASTVDDEWSNFPLKPLYPVFFKEVVKYLSDDSTRIFKHKHLFAGGRISVNDFSGVKEYKRIFIEPPNSERVNIGQLLAGNQEYLLKNSGIYAIDYEQGSRHYSEYFDVNLKSLAKEGDYKKVDAGIMAKVFHPAAIAELDLYDNFIENLFSLLEGRELSGLLFWVLIFFLIAESFLAGDLKFKKYHALFAIMLLSQAAYCGYGNKFVYAQLKHSGHWDPYPDIHREILSFLTATTSIQPAGSRLAVDASSAELFDSAFLFVLGSGDIGEFNQLEIENLRNYVSAGGIIFADSSDAVLGSVFVKSVKREFSRINAQAGWNDIPPNSAVLRSFYLMKSAGGRRIINEKLSGLKIDDFFSVIISENDLLGAWARDSAGSYLYECSPYGESQRVEAVKLTANVIIYALTGTYKEDAVHLPFILMKLKNKY